MVHHGPVLTDLTTWALTLPFVDVREKSQALKVLLNSKAASFLILFLLKNLHLYISQCNCASCFTILQVFQKSSPSFVAGVGVISVFFTRFYIFVGMYLKLVPYHPVSSLFKFFSCYQCFHPLFSTPFYCLLVYLAVVYNLIPPFSLCKTLPARLSSFLKNVLLPHFARNIIPLCDSPWFSKVVWS